jgi:hypothetical protein
MLEDGITAAAGVGAFVAPLALLALLFLPLMAEARSEVASGTRLELFEGDYTIAVYPRSETAAEPETAISEEAVGGGGGRFTSGLFDLELVGLGELTQGGVKGEYGALTPETYWARGYIQDGLISHGFLRQYGSWTIDFDSMTFLFEQPE